MQSKIKECNDFLEHNAARKEAFISEKYYQEQIAAVRAQKDQGWEKEVATLEKLAAD